MELIILFIILSLISYLVIKRSASQITNTPMILLWLALMSPPLIWAGWYFMNPDQDSMPKSIIIFPLILSPLLYFFLLEMGRPKGKNKQKETISVTEPKTTTVSSSTTDNQQEENNQKSKSISVFSLLYFLYKRLIIHHKQFYV